MLESLTLEQIRHQLTEVRRANGEMARIWCDQEDEISRLRAQAEADAATIAELRDGLENALEWADWLKRQPHYTPIMKAQWPDEARALLQRTEELAAVHEEATC